MSPPYAFLAYAACSFGMARLTTKSEIPPRVVSTVERIFGSKAATTMVDAHNYVVNKSNPLGQLAYLVLGLGSWSVYFAYAFPLIIASKTVPTWHVYTGALTFLACVGSFQIACASYSGSITSHTIPKFDNYDYDEVIFFKDRICPTVGIKKLARSKYCRNTNSHIPRFDHYCGWLRNPVGEENYRIFLLFLAIQTFTSYYGGYITALLFLEEIEEKDLWNQQFLMKTTNEIIPASPKVICHYFLLRHTGVCGCFLLQVVLGICFTGFLAFHIMLVCRNMTTNEFMKWRQVRKWHKQAKKKYLKAVKEGRTNKGKTENIVAQNKAALSAAADSHENVDIGCTGAPSGFIQNTDDKDNDNDNDENDTNSKEETEGKEMDDTVDPGPLPTNMYNIGIIENMKEVLYPRSLRKEALIKWQISLQKKKRR